MLDILSGIGAIELIERTSSTLRVQQVVQLIHGRYHQHCQQV